MSRLHLLEIKGKRRKSVLEEKLCLAREAGVFGEEEGKGDEKDVRRRIVIIHHKSGAGLGLVWVWDKGRGHHFIIVTAMWGHTTW